MDPSADGDLRDVDLLVHSAERLRWRAPELSLVLARRALAMTDRDSGGGADSLAARAQALVVANLAHLGRHADAVQPAIDALLDSEAFGHADLAARLRVDLAASSRLVGIPGAGFVVLRPVLDGGAPTRSVLAGALAEAVSCLAHFGRRDELDEALAEADRLYAADDTLDPDTRRVLRALLAARTASYRRRHGDTAGAAAAANEGFALLDELSDHTVDSGQARGRLTLELVSALLDQSDADAAWHHAVRAVAEPPRAGSASGIGRLMLAVAIRIMLPVGRIEQGQAWLGDAAALAERHELETLLVDALTTLTYVHELLGEPTAALETLRRARAAEYRHLRAVAEARIVLVERLRVGSRVPDDAVDLVRAALRAPAPAASPAPKLPPSTAAAWAAGPAPGSDSPPLAASVPGRPEYRPPAAESGGRRRAPEVPATDIPAAAAAAGLPTGGKAVNINTVNPGTVSRDPAGRDTAKRAEGDRETVERDTETGLLSGPGLRRRVAAARKQDRPTALTLVRLDQPAEQADEPGSGAAADRARNQDPDVTDRFSRDLIRSLDQRGPDQGGGADASEWDTQVFSSLADHVRDLAPERAELARGQDGELAVLLPDTTRDEAERFAAEVRESIASSEWLTEDTAGALSVSTGVAQVTPETSEDMVLGAARADLTAAEPDQHGPAEPDRGDTNFPDTSSPDGLAADVGSPADAGFLTEARIEDYTYFEEYVASRESPPAPAEPVGRRHGRAAGDTADTGDTSDPYSPGFVLSQLGRASRQPDPASGPADPADPIDSTGPTGTTDPTEPAQSRHGAEAGGGRHAGGAAGSDGRSVLERLGIAGAGGSGGRRRRAREEPGPDQPRSAPVPDLTLPDLTLPELTLPELTLPDLTVPEVPHVPEAPEPQEDPTFPEPPDVPDLPEPADVPPVPGPDVPGPQPEVPEPEQGPTRPRSQEPEPVRLPTRDPEPGEPTSLSGRTARRRRARREVGLADLLAEALAAYQSTTSEQGAEPLFGYEDPVTEQRRRSNPAS